jgi:hypothetical protein
MAGWDLLASPKSVGGLGFSEQVSACQVDFQDRKRRG